MATTEKTLSELFAKAGHIVSSEIIEFGQSPHKSFLNVWYHENGSIEYDGENWRYFPAKAFYISPSTDGY